MQIQNLLDLSGSIHRCLPQVNSVADWLQMQFLCLSVCSSKTAVCMMLSQHKQQLEATLAKPGAREWMRGQKEVEGSGRGGIGKDPVLRLSKLWDNETQHCLHAVQYICSPFLLHQSM